MKSKAKEILTLLEQYLVKNPSVRVGQALSNLGIQTFENNSNIPSDIFYDTDAEILQRMKKMVKSLRKGLIKGNVKSIKGSKLAPSSHMVMAITPPSQEEKPKEHQRRKRKKEKDANEECPEGHEFGKDWYEYDKCDACDKFIACREEEWRKTK